MLLEGLSTRWVFTPAPLNRRSWFFIQFMERLLAFGLGLLTWSGEVGDLRGLVQMWFQDRKLANICVLVVCGTQTLCLHSETFIFLLLCPPARRHHPHSEQAAPAHNAKRQLTILDERSLEVGTSKKKPR